MDIVKSTQLRKSFDKLKVEFNTGLKTRIPFEFNYSGDLPIHSIELGCGCTHGELIDGAKIKGYLQIYDKDYYKPSPVDPTNPDSPLNPIVKVEKTITVFFDDGQPWFVINDKKHRNANPEKLKIVLRISGYVDTTKYA